MKNSTVKVNTDSHNQSESNDSRLRLLISQAPFSISIFRGSNFITETANTRALELWGKKEEDILNKPILETMPEFKSQGIKELLHNVYTTGKIFTISELPVQIKRNGKLDTVYLNFTYEPTYNLNGEIDGVMSVGYDITDQIQARKKIEASEEFNRTVLESSPDCLKILDSEGRLQYMNFNGLCQMEIDDFSQLKDKFWWNLWGSENEQMVKSVVDKALAGETAQFIAYCATAKGTPKWWDVMVSPIGKIGEKSHQIISVSRDITMQRKADLKIIENEKKLNIVIEASELGTFELDLKTNEINYSKKFQEILGFSVTDKPNHAKFLSRLHSGDLTIRDEAYKKAFVTGSLYYESRINLDDNTIRFVEVKGKVFYDEDKSPKNLIGTCRDITEEKKYRKGLEEREQKFRLLADSMPQHIWTADTQGNLNYYNQSVFDYSGLSLEKINEDGWIQIVHPDDKEANIKSWIEAVTTGKDFLFEHRFRRHDGTYRWQLSRAKPQRDENGNIRMWVGTSTDIQEHKSFSEALEAEVRERTKDLDQNIADLANMNRELQSFAYISSHDLQEPLRKIQTFASRIAEKEKDNLSETGKDLFARMQKSAERMQSLIDDLLAYSRTHTLQKDFKKVNLCKVIDNVIQDLKEEIEQKNATVQIKETCEVNVIPFQFHQLFYNLVSNSLKFSVNQQSIHITINCVVTTGSKFENENLESTKKYCHISVADNGIGFEMQYSERIFELFQRLHGKDEYRGTGVGLSIVKRIVENHNGIITARGEIGKGATFDIYLPVAE